MRLTDDITLRPQPFNDEPSGEVWIAGRSTGTIVSGCVLEAAVRCRRGWLLFVTDGVPYEDMLTIHLLDERGRLLDSARIGGPYATGSFSQVRVEPPAIVRFRFIDDADWSVRVLDKPRPAVPWWPDARGVWRGARLTRHFELRRTPA